MPSLQNRVIPSEQFVCQQFLNLIELGAGWTWQFERLFLSLLTKAQSPFNWHGDSAYQNLKSEANLINVLCILAVEHNSGACDELPIPAFYGSAAAQAQKLLQHSSRQSKFRWVPDYLEIPIGWFLDFSHLLTLVQSGLWLRKQLISNWLDDKLVTNAFLSSGERWWDKTKNLPFKNCLLSAHYDKKKLT